MERRTLWLAGGIIAAALGWAAHQASRGPLREAAAVQRLYDRLAPVYDPFAGVFRILGARRLQGHAVDLLGLRPGDTVVDLGCGTGVNLLALATAVGEHGHVVGVDLSEGMLQQAHRRVGRLNLAQVSLEQADIREYRLPIGTSAVLATASFEMIPQYDDVVRDLAAQLASTGGRLAIGGFRRPPDWPEWAVALGRGATAVFGVTRAYEDIQPWRSVQLHMDEIAFGTAARGSLYLVVARPRPD